MTPERSTASTTTSKPRTGQCVHHWVIEAPNGRASKGVCKHCSKSRSFANSTENVMWEQTNTLRNELRGTIHIPKPTEMRLADEN